MAKLFFLGTSDAFNAAGRANSCYWVEDTLGHYVVDFGPTALYQCQRYGLDVNRLDGVFLTHLHGDHIGGLAMLLVHLQYQANRKRPLVIAGPEGTEQRVLALRKVHIRQWFVLDSSFLSNIELGRCPAMWMF